MDDSRTNSKTPSKLSDRYLLFFLIFALLLVHAILNMLFGQSHRTYATFNINNISTYVWNNGQMDITPNNKGGFFFPKEDQKKLFNCSGFLFGGIVGDLINVQGSHFKSAFLPGKVLDNGLTENPEDEECRVFKVRPDYKTADLTNEIEYDSISIIKTFEDFVDPTYNFEPLQTEQEIRLNYEKDWLEWPAAKGAPFDDNDGDGEYNPHIDVPGVKGADQTLWFVMNDFNPETALEFIGSLPLKIEVQVTIWGYNKYNFLDNYLFKKYKIINKSDSDITKSYFAIWTDPDIGYNLNDFVGCDTTLNLGFAYNGSLNDPLIKSVTPAAGYLLLDNSKRIGSDTGINSFAFKAEYGCFPGFDNYCYVSHEPGLEAYPMQALIAYNLFLGKIGSTGQPFIDPNTGLPTKFSLAGDPVNRTGWFDGQLHRPGERAFLMTTGPFDLPANDTVILTFAQFAAYGRDRLNSVSFLKNQTRFIKTKYPNFEELKKDISPPKPKINSISSNFNNSINLAWDKGSESFENNGYKFQGYNIYQFFSEQNLLDNAIKIETFDIVDNIRDIYGIVKSPVSGNPYTGTVQKGKNNGVKNSININFDFTKNIPLADGNDYWFGVSAYYYNEENGKSVESKICQIKITPNFRSNNFSELNRYKLQQNYPNPFNPTTKINFTIPYAGDASLRQGTINASPAYANIIVYDLLGREVRVLYKGNITAGEHVIDFNAEGLPSGVYFYSLTVDGKLIDRKKMVLLK